MLKPNQFVKVKWNGNNRKHYENNGYIFTKFGEVFEAKAEDLPCTSHAIVIAICDYCGKEIEVSMTNYTRSIKRNGKIACSDCRFVKSRETMIKEYGVPHAMQVEEFKQKVKQTCLERYGCANPAQNAEIKAKQRDTMLKNYGVAVPFQVPEFKAKAEETCLANFGTTNPMKSKEVQDKAKLTMIENYGAPNPGLVPSLVEKAKQTCVEKFGGESSQCSPEIRAKTWETLKDKNGLPSSSVERKLVSMLQELFGKENCSEQYIAGMNLFDCLLVVDGVKIDVEYDGWYWHKNKVEKDKRRNYYWMRRGYKILRYQSNGELPTPEQIKKDVEYLLNTDHHHLIVKMNDIQDEDIV